MLTTVLVFRLVFACAALLSIATGALVTASFFMARYASPSNGFLVISLVVTAVFLGAGLVLFGIQRHVAAIATAHRGHKGDPPRDLSPHINRLVAYLLAGGAFVCVLLGSLAYAILERVGQGMAVFG
jgi:hypothetical protein